MSDFPHRVLIGTCSLCHGPVVDPSHMRATELEYLNRMQPGDYPKPHCLHCGAVSIGLYGPVIPMQRAQRDEWGG